MAPNQAKPVRFFLGTLTLGLTTMPTMTKLQNSLFLLLLTLLLGAAGQLGLAQSAEPAPLAQRGRLDLSQWNPAQGPVALAGEWEFTWNQFLPPDPSLQPRQQPDLYAPLPRHWNDYQLQGRSLPGSGHASYRLLVTLPAQAESLGLELGLINSAYRLYANGKLLLSMGMVGEEAAASTPSWGGNLVELPAMGGEIEILLLVSNHDHRLGGAWSPIRLGQMRHLIRDLEQDHALSLVLFGASLILGIYQLALFVQRRGFWPDFFFGLFCLNVALRSLVWGDVLLHHIWQEVAWWPVPRILSLTFFWGVAFLVFYFSHLFPGLCPPRLKQGLLGLTLLFTLSLALPANLFTYGENPFRILTIALGLFLLLRLFALAKAKNPKAIYSFLGLMGLWGCVLHDMGVRMTKLAPPELLPFGLLLFLFSQSLAQSKEYSDSLKEVDRLSGELETKKLNLVRQDKMRDEFLTRTSKELEQPLQGLIAIADSLLVREGPKLEPSSREHLKLIGISGRKLNYLLAGILDHTRLKHGEIRLQLGPVGVKEQVDLVLLLLQASTKAKGLELLNLVPESFPLVAADSARLQQILFHLVSNSVKFSNQGQITVDAQQEAGMAHLVIADQGLGLSNAAELPQSGRELGPEAENMRLNITKRLIELHQGRLWFDSQAGKGTQVHFTLPLVQPEELDAWLARDQKGADPAGSLPAQPMIRIGGPEQPEVQPALPNRAEATAGKPASGYGKLTILSVDDDPINQVVVENFLALHQFRVVKAYNGKEMLSLLENGLKPDLILLDVMMPGLNGLELCRRLRNSYSVSQLPIIFLAANTEIKDIVTSLEYGGNDYLTKPFSKAELLARINNCLALVQGYRQTTALLNFSHQIGDLRTPQEILAAAQALMAEHLVFGEVYFYQESKLENRPPPEHPLSRWLPGSFSTRMLDHLFAQAEQNLVYFSWADPWPEGLEKPQHLQAQEKMGHLVLLRPKEMERALFLISLEPVPDLLLHNALQFLESILQEISAIQTSLRQIFTDRHLLQVLHYLDQNRAGLLSVNSSGAYCEVNLEGKHQGAELFRVSIQNLELACRDYGLVRVHRSWLVNPLKVKTAQRKGSRDFELIIKGGHPNIPLGRSFFTPIRQQYPQWFK